LHTLKQSKIKLITFFHKPYFYISDDVNIPMHVGRAVALEKVKDENISNDDLRWLMENTLGDDMGNNISELNRYFCEMSGIYWCWKNYDKIGNPEYIGFQHYRRLFANNRGYKNLSSELLSYINKYDFITIPLRYDKISNREHYNKSEFHISSDLDIATSIAQKHDAYYANNLIEYLDKNQGFFLNMFIMKKELFFEYCNTIFPILLETHSKINYEGRSIDQNRSIGFLAERLTGAYLYQKIKEDMKNKPLKFVYINEKGKIINGFNINWSKKARRWLIDVKFSKKRKRIVILGITFLNKEKIRGNIFQ